MMLTRAVLLSLILAAPAQAVDLQQLGEQLNRLEQKVDRLTALLLKQQPD